METSLFLPGVGPYSMDVSEKARFLHNTLDELLSYHTERCPGYAKLTADWFGRRAEESIAIADYPYIPVSLFKEYELRSIQDDLAVVQSSSTTSNNAAKIYVDKESRKRQTRSANLILSDFIGGERRPYLVFDLESTVRGTKGFSARGAAIMALAHIASEFFFVMREGDNGLELDHEALAKAMSKIDGKPFIAYGFTYILYQAHEAMSGEGKWQAHPESVFLHSGGWKKLIEIAVDKPTFNARVAEPWGLRSERVIDFYGMVEQIGVVYPDCPEGVKHVPYWAEVIMRRADTLEPADPGEPGLIQLISALPLAAPNHSVLSEDLGCIVHTDGCPCGRSGTAFTFQGRAPRSETRGCSDVVRR